MKRKGVGMVMLVIMPAFGSVLISCGGQTANAALPMTADTTGAQIVQGVLAPRIKPNRLTKGVPFSMLAAVSHNIRIRDIKRAKNCFCACGIEDMSSEMVRNRI